MALSFYPVKKRKQLFKKADRVTSNLPKTTTITTLVFTFKNNMGSVV